MLDSRLAKLPRQACNNIAYERNPYYRKKKTPFPLFFTHPHLVYSTFLTSAFILTLRNTEQRISIENVEASEQKKKSKRAVLALPTDVMQPVAKKKKFMYLLYSCCLATEEKKK